MDPLLDSVLVTHSDSMMDFEMVRLLVSLSVPTKENQTELSMEFSESIPK